MPRSAVALRYLRTRRAQVQWCDVNLSRNLDNTETVNIMSALVDVAMNIRLPINSRYGTFGFGVSTGELSLYRQESEGVEAGLQSCIPNFSRASRMYFD